MDEARLNLTRRFRSVREARDEAESNLSAGSLWVPLAEGAERPALLRAVIVALQLEDGTVLEGLRGRVTCVAPSGVAVVLDDLPSANVLTRLLGGERPPPPSLSRDLAPEDAPPLPAGLEDAWQPIPSAPGIRPLTPPPPPLADPFAAMAPLPPPIVAEDTLPTVKAPAAAPALDTPLATFDAPPAFDSPAPMAASFDSPARAPEAFEPRRDTAVADFPMMRETVPAVGAKAGMWDDDGSLDPELKTLKQEEPTEPPRPQFTVRFLDGAALETAWKGELGAGRVLVPMTGGAEAPPLDSHVEVTLLLPDVGALVLEGTVVHRGGANVGVRLDLDAATRGLIESALPSNNPSPSPAPARVTSAADTNATPDAPAVTPRRPSMELVKDASGRTVLVVKFDSLGDFRREYESNIRRGGVMVPTPDRPPVRSVIEIVFSLLNGKREVRLKGEVVLHGPTGIGVQLAEIPQTTRVEIDSLIAAAGGGADPEPPSSRSSVITPPPPMRNAPPPPSIGPTPLTSGPPFANTRPITRAPVAFTPAGTRFGGELVEVMREAEVEGEAGVAGIGAKASWLKVLAHLQASRSTGVLKATRKAETKYYVVHQGRILDAKGEPPREDESLLRVIRKNNLAKPGVLRVLDRALDKAPDEIKALEGANVMSPAEVDRVRRWQILERSSEIFAWEKGRFDFEPDGDRAWARPTGGVPVGHVILHGVRSYLRASGEDLARILRGGMDRALKVVPDTGFEPARVGMSDKELTFWAELDGKKSLRQLLATSPIGASHAHRLVFALCRLGVLAFDRSSAAARVKDADRLDLLKTRLSDMKSRDLFSRLGISWMSAAQQVQLGWDALRRELDTDSRSPGTADITKEILALAEGAWRQLMDERTRRLQRLKIIEDPSRIEAAADMLADRAELLRLQGDRGGAESALQMALDMVPGNSNYIQQLQRVRAG